jgi:hypothetical protein
MATAKKAIARGGSYSASDIQVLEGLEPVRKRPAMYIGGIDLTGYHHLLWEIVDNSVDEVINGYAEKIEVTLHKDGRTVAVTDDGRGIPVDMHPQYRKPALEIILTTLHSGGKFEQELPALGRSARGGQPVVNAPRASSSPRSSASRSGGSRRSPAARRPLRSSRPGRRAARARRSPSPRTRRSSGRRSASSPI